MVQIHFHVDQHDVGYLPNSDPYTYESIDGALESVWLRAEEHIDFYCQGDLAEPVRGQITSEDPWTGDQEVADVERQVNEFKAKLAQDPEYMEQIAENGLIIVLDAGIAVIELSPCSEEECVIHMEEWGD